MIKLVITLKRRAGMTREDYKRYHQEIHLPLLVAIPEAQRYLRRFVVSFPILAPDQPEPSYDSVVEAWFDSLEDMNAFYSSENFKMKVDPDHPKFLDLASVGRIVAEEDVVIVQRPTRSSP